MEQIEEWNEYGELKDQIAATQDFGTFTAPAPISAASLTPDVAATSTTSTPKRSGPPSRASSETRHISIAEPSEREKERGSDGKAPASQKTAESPMNVTIKQLGTEAAAKAAQKKVGAGTQSPKAAATPTSESGTLEQTPSPAATKFSTEAAVDSGDMAAVVTAAKTPAQLATEGAGRTSVGKIADSEDKLAASAAELDSPNPMSTEEQQLAMRRTSSVTKTKSRLSEATPIDESHTVNAESEPSPESPSIALPKSEVDTTPTMPRQHRGSDVGEASMEEIRALEKKMAIPEEEEEGHAKGEPQTEPATKASAVSATDRAEEEVSKGTDTRKTDPKDADKAGFSVGD